MTFVDSTETRTRLDEAFQSINPQLAFAFRLSAAQDSSRKTPSYTTPAADNVSSTKVGELLPRFVTNLVQLQGKLTAFAALRHAALPNRGQLSEGLQDWRNPEWLLYYDGGPGLAELAVRVVRSGALVVAAGQKRKKNFSHSVGTARLAFRGVDQVCSYLDGCGKRGAAILATAKKGECKRSLLLLEYGLLLVGLMNVNQAILCLELVDLRGRERRAFERTATTLATDLLDIAGRVNELQHILNLPSVGPRTGSRAVVVRPAVKISPSGAVDVVQWTLHVVRQKFLDKGSLVRRT